MRAVAALFLVVLGPVAFACDSTPVEPVDSLVGTYELQSLDGITLPYRGVWKDVPVGGPNFDFVSGFLGLNPDRTFQMVEVFQYNWPDTTWSSSVELSGTFSVDKSGIHLREDKSGIRLILGLHQRGRYTGSFSGIWFTVKPDWRDSGTRVYLKR